MSESNRLLEPREPRGAGNEPKRERPHGKWHSILLRAGSWLRHQLDFLDRLFEDAQRGEGHAQMRHDYAVRNALVTHGHMPHGFQANMNDRVLAQTKSAYPVGENDWGTHAADGRCLTGLARNALGEDWWLCVGFIGHDGLPRSFNPQSGEWDLTAPPGRAKEAARGDGNPA